MSDKCIKVSGYLNIRPIRVPNYLIEDLADLGTQPRMVGDFKDYQLVEIAERFKKDLLARAAEQREEDGEP